MYVEKPRFKIGEEVCVVRSTWYSKTLKGLGLRTFDMINTPPTAAIVKNVMGQPMFNHVVYTLEFTDNLTQRSHEPDQLMSDETGMMKCGEHADHPPATRRYLEHVTTPSDSNDLSRGEVYFAIEHGLADDFNYREVNGHVFVEAFSYDDKLLSETSRVLSKDRIKDWRTTDKQALRSYYRAKLFYTMQRRGKYPSYIQKKLTDLKTSIFKG